MKIESPYGMSGRERYRQATRLWSLRKALSPRLWNSGARDQPVQLHVWADGGAMARTAIWHAGEWLKGPPLTYQDTLKGAPGLRQALFRLAADGLNGRKIAGLGLVLHVADEFAVSPLQPAVTKSAEDVRIASFTVIEDPGAVVLGESDSDLAANTWRVVPTLDGTPRAGALAAKLSQDRLAWLGAFQQLFGNQIPFRIEVASAPLELFVALPDLLPPIGDARRVAARVVALHYLRFTALFLVTADGRLAGISSLPHSGRSIPHGFAERIRTEIQNLAGAEPASVILVKGSPLADPASLIAEMTRANDSDPTFFEDLDVSVIEIGAPEVADWERELGCESIGLMPEMSVDSGHEAESPGDVWLRDRVRLVGACTQNFLLDDLVLGRALPTGMEMRLLGLAKVLRVGAAIGLVGYAGATGLEFFNVVTGPAWGLDPAIAAESAGRADAFRAARAAMDSWGAMADAPPSQAWSVVEFVSRVIPDGAGVILTKPVEYEARLERIRMADGSVASGVGLHRIWRLSGISKGTSQTPLFEQARIHQIVAELATLPGCAAFAPGIGVEVSVTGSLERLTTSVTTASGLTFDHGFSATITIRVPPGENAPTWPSDLAPFPGEIDQLTGTANLAQVGG